MIRSINTVEGFTFLRSLIVWPLSSTEILLVGLADDTADDISDDEEDDDDDEDQDSMEADLDKDEALKAEPGRVQGDRLLLSHYTVSTDKKNRVCSTFTSLVSIRVPSVHPPTTYFAIRVNSSSPSENRENEGNHSKHMSELETCVSETHVCDTYFC